VWGFGQSRRVRQLEEDLEKLRGSFKALQLEWDDVYDKLRRAMARIVKSRAILEAKEPTELQEGAAERGLQVLSGTPHGRLTDHQKEIQQEILRRRAGG
jgi:actin-like ATPase involved in cell morphogenesis